MCIDTVSSTEGPAVSASYGLYILLTPEVRGHLQVCLVNVELLAGMHLPGSAHYCVVALERAMDGLVRAVAQPVQVRGEQRAEA